MESLVLKLPCQHSSKKRVSTGAVLGLGFVDVETRTKGWSLTREGFHLGGSTIQPPPPPLFCSFFVRMLLLVSVKREREQQRGRERGREREREKEGEETEGGRKR